MAAPERPPALQETLDVESSPRGMAATVATLAGQQVFGRLHRVVADTPLLRAGAPLRSGSGRLLDRRMDPMAGPRRADVLSRSPPAGTHRGGEEAMHRWAKQDTGVEPAPAAGKP